MATESQILANRDNAKKSTGPRSAETKAISSRNHTIHGIFVGIPALDEEERTQLHQLYKTLSIDYAAQSPSEALLVWDMAVAHFRRQRAVEAENIYYVADKTRWLETNPDTDESWDPAAATHRLMQSGDLLKLNRYQRTFERTWEKRLAELRRLQRDRIARQKQEQAEQDAAFDREFEETSARALAGVEHLISDTLANNPFSQSQMDEMAADLATWRKSVKP